MCECVCVHGHVRVCVRACVNVCVLVRWSACTGVLAACAAAGSGGFSAALAVACAEIDSNRRCRRLAVRGRAVCVYSVCRSILGLPVGPVPRPMPPATPPAVQPAIPAVLPPPQPAHTITAHTSHRRSSCRARVCARSCACRWRCRSRRWPAGKLCDCPRHSPEAARGRARLCEVLGVLEVLTDTVRVSPAL